MSPVQKTNILKLLLGTANNRGHINPLQVSKPRAHPESHHTIVMACCLLCLVLCSQCSTGNEQPETPVRLQGTTPIHRERFGMIEQSLLNTQS